MSAPVEKSIELNAVPNLRHGFFGRRGGVSTGVYASLNMALASDDDMNLVASNRTHALESLGFPGAALVGLTQVHSSEVVALSVAPAPGILPKADALVTKVPGLALSILTADCVPILFVDPVSGVIGAAHAGWKGAMGGVIANTVAAMTALGARPQNIRAAIGPAISGDNYEVGPQFAADLLARHPGAAKRITKQEGAREHFDLPGFVSDQLAAAGVGKIERVGGCTYARPELYFSHRRATHAGATTGRQMAVIGLV